MEKEWTEDQKLTKNERLLNLIYKKRRPIDYIDQVLIKCREHGGTVTFLAELLDLWNTYSEMEKILKSYLRLEILCKKFTHPQDVQARPTLYKVNLMSVEQLYENMVILLGSDDKPDETIVFTCED